MQIEDGETNLLHATWSRSGKRLILAVVPRGRWADERQVELTQDQAQKLATFIVAGPP